MGRQVVTQRDLDLAWETSTAPNRGETRGAITRVEEGGTDAADSLLQSGRSDQFTDRLLKYIPAEVIVVYVSVEGLIRNAPADIPQQKLLWGVFFFLLIGTWIYLARVQRVRKNVQLLISTSAFAVWVFSLGGPFASLSWYKPFYGALLLPLYTFSVSAIKAESF